MLSIIVCFCLALTGFLAYRERVKYRRAKEKSSSKIFKKAEKLIALKQWEGAERQLRYLYENTEQCQKLFFLYARVLREMHHFEEALRWVQYGLKKYPEDLFIRIEEGKIHSKMQEWEKALCAFEKAYPALRDHEDYYFLAEILYHLGRCEEAWVILSPLIETSPDAKLVTLAADSLLQLGESSEAIKCYHLALQKGDKTHSLLTKLAHAYKKEGALQEAEILFSKILSNDSTDVDATLGLGSCMEERQSFEKALEIYKSSKAWEKGNTSLLYQSALCAYKTGQFCFAEHCFVELLKKTNPSPTLLSYLGLVLENLEKWEEAEECYLSMVRFFPKHPEGYLAIARLFGIGKTKLFSPEKGVQFAYYALELRPDPSSWEILSACEARVGNFEHALQIQEYLFATTSNKKDKARLQAAIRQLRAKGALCGTHILRRLVA